jgi:hypothetical protein
VTRLPLLLLGLALVLPATGSALTVGGAVSGTGKATTFWIVTGGEVVQGGAFDMNFACYGCYVRFTVETSAITVVQNGAEQTLAPGSYQIPGYVGFIGITTSGPHDFFLELHGEGPVSPWAP